MSLISKQEESQPANVHPLAKNIDKVLVPTEIIYKRIERMGEQISKDYAGKNLVIIGVLKGALPFMAALIKCITVPMVIDFVALSSYEGGTSSTGVVRFQKDVEEPLEGQHVLVVEDIVDTGLTLHYLLKTLKLRNPKSLEVCCLISKPSRRKIDIDVKYLGFTIPDRFIVGFGMDYQERYRNLDYIGVLSPAAITP
ncbi:MAG: hypoxanthine phosphoribosyltransferase [Candidatus Bruticola sp.]